MSQAIWMLRYQIERPNIETYESWFHRVHIPEKLSRPGYTWASHYKAQLNDEGNQYVAMFGGLSSRVFHDPSPAQLKLTQNEETRQMMSMRQRGSGIIFVEEWSEFGHGKTPQTPIQSPAIRINWFDARGQDEDLSAWLVQELTPQLLNRQEGAEQSPLAVCKLLGVNGIARHAVIEQYGSISHLSPLPDSLEQSTWRARVESAVDKPFGDPLELDRIWPSP